MNNILFRADSSSLIGTGHIMRDLVLANKYKKSNIIFATQDLEGNINSKIVEAGYQLETLNSNNIDEIIKLIKKYNINMVVIDHYKIDNIYEEKLKEKTQVKILSLDDTYEKHHCDILLNHNINANKKKYKNLVPSNCELRCGSKYTLLRDEFLIEKAKKRKIKKEKSINIFIAMGGADHTNINTKILKVLKNCNNLDINIVTTTANKNIKKLKQYIQKYKNIKLHINSNEIAKLMKKSDFAIVTPSVTVNEIYYLDVPFIAIKTAINQNEIYKYLKKNDFMVLEKFKEKELLKKITKMITTLEVN